MMKTICRCRSATPLVQGLAKFQGLPGVSLAQLQRSSSRRLAVLECDIIPVEYAVRSNHINALYPDLVNYSAVFQ